MAKKFSHIKLRELADKRGISQHEIARLLETYIANVNGWFTGKNVPGGNTVAGLAHVLKVPIDDLYEDEESERMRATA